MGFLLVFLFIAVPIAELYVIIKVGEWIGVLPTLALLFADALLGSLLLRHQGRSAWRRFNAAIAEGRFPGREAADGVMVAVGGTLLLAPGFITDVAGLVLLIPPTRALIRGGTIRFLSRRIVPIGIVRRGFGGPDRTPSDRPYDFEGSAREMPTNGTGDSDRTPDDPGPHRLPPP
jgi:UPF0716 protein FxsA